MQDLDQRRIHTSSTMHRNTRLVSRRRRERALRRRCLGLAKLLLGIGLVVVCALFVFPQLQRSESPVEAVLIEVEEPEPMFVPLAMPITPRPAVPTTTPEPEPEPIVELRYQEHEAQMVAQTVWGEIRGGTKDEWRLVVWCICNRVDSQYNGFKNQNTIEKVVTARNQFHGYSSTNPIDEDIMEVVLEELYKWSAGEEAPIIEPYATTSEYLFFYGDGVHNWFREEW